MSDSPSSAVAGWLPSWLYYIPLGLGGFMIMLYFFQERLLYFPDVPAGYRRHMLDPTEYNLPAPEHVQLRMSDGIHVQLWFFRHATGGKTRNTIVFFHGNAGNLSFRLDNFRALYRDCGVNVLAVEYRGYGLSEGSPSEPALKSDAQEVLDWFLSREDVNSKGVYLLGRSLGGGVVLHLAAANHGRIAGIIVENTFTSISDMIDALMPKLTYFKFLSRNKWDNLSIIQTVKLPVLFICSGRDELIPAHMMPLLREKSASSVKEWMFFAEAQHMSANTFFGYTRGISSFMAKVMSLNDQHSDGVTPVGYNTQPQRI